MFFNYSVGNSAPPQGVAQAVTQTRKGQKSTGGADDSIRPSGAFYVLHGSAATAF